MISRHPRSTVRGAALTALLLVGTAMSGCATMTGGAPEATSPPTTLAAHRDSFAIRVQDRVVGAESTVLERSATGWRYTSVTSAPGVKQTTVVRVTPTGEMEHMQQRDERGTVAAVSELAYAEGRVRGTIQLPAQGAPMTTLGIDTLALSGVVDDNFVAALEPSLAWAPDARVSMSVFVGGKNETQQWTYQVVGTESVTVPAGTFAAYRVEQRIGARVMMLHVEVAAPHRVLKRAPVGSPLEFVRVR